MKFLARRKSTTLLAVLVLFAGLVISTPSFAQVRGLYLPGLNATNSGILPAPGLTYLNYFEFLSFDKLKGPKGGTASVNIDANIFADLNIFVYVTKYKLLGGEYAVMAGLPFMNASLTLADRSIGGGGGFGESFYQPFLLGWKSNRYNINTGYCFFLNTGNAGAGYGGNALTLGDTFYLTKNKAIAFSSYQFYEFHTRKSETQVTPGQAFSLDYSLLMTLPLQKDMKSLLQFGLEGYGQWQTTNNSGPGANPILSNIHYKVNGIGFGADVILPPKGVVLTMRYFNEYGGEATVEGKTFHVSATVTF